MKATLLRAALFALFIGTVVAANWALATFGLVGVGFGLVAPAGVYFAGATFGLRDALHEAGGRNGRLWVLGAILVGALVSYAIEGSATVPGGLAPIAVASAAAFLLGELADFAVYSPLHERSWPMAVVASNTVGAVIDSALFLYLAFGGLGALAGNVFGKTLMVLPALVGVWAVRRWRSRRAAVSPVYLAGPINGCTDDETTTWREIVKRIVGDDNCLDPMRRDYRGREDQCVAEIVEGDKADIRRSGVVIANCWQPSPGTSMEILFAHELGKPVIVVVPPGKRVSPWYRHHATEVVTDLIEAIDLAAARVGLSPA